MPYLLNNLVISTGANPDFLLRSTGQSRVCAFLFKERRMRTANATKLNRKSGVAEWRDLRFLRDIGHPAFARQKG
jgi:hypothetical protein